jgi:tetratricopeptide (TPR) repeat protein
MTRLLIIAALFTLTVPALARAQHEDHAAMAPDQIGSASVKFDISCAAAVKPDFNAAVAMLHSFWFPEATKAFEAVAQKDPSCAMAYWGVAMSQWGNPFGGLRNVQAIERGAATVAKARATGMPTPRERALIDAVGILYSSTEAATQRDRVLKYELAMEALAKQYRADIEVRIYHALAVSQSALPTDKTYGKQLQAAEILEPLFKQMPTHPGLAHYIIHAYDAPPLAAKGLAAARRYAALAPAVPHALHMPSHTFTRVGSWKESIDTNRRSAETARKGSDSGAELHALDYQTYAFLQIGQDAAAQAVVSHVASMTTSANAFAMAAIPARYALERGDWAGAAALTAQPAAATPYTEAMTHFARAVGASRSGNPAAATPALERMVALRDQLMTMKDAYWTEQVEIQRRVALAWQTFAQGQKNEGVAQLKAAADAEDATDKAAVTPGPLAPARELYGEMLMEAGRAGEALVAFEATTKKEPNRFRGVYGAARAAEATGNKAKATTYYRQLLEIAKDADTERPALVAARAFSGR